MKSRLAHRLDLFLGIMFWKVGVWAFTLHVFSSIIICTCTTFSSNLWSLSSSISCVDAFVYSPPLDHWRTNYKNSLSISRLSFKSVVFLRERKKIYNKPLVKDGTFFRLNGFQLSSSKEFDTERKEENDENEIVDLKNTMQELEEAFGVGIGKHQRQKRPKKKNKYAKFSNFNDETLDPLDKMLQKAGHIQYDLDESDQNLNDKSLRGKVREQQEQEQEGQVSSEVKHDEVNEDGQNVGSTKRIKNENDSFHSEHTKQNQTIDTASFPGEDTEAKELIEYPNILDVDPYDPGTFGFTEIGIITTSHGIKGEVKVKTTSNFAEERLTQKNCIRYIKAPNRRYPRAIELTRGRKMNEDIFIVALQDVDGKEKAEKLRDYTLYVKSNDRPELETNEFLVSDMIGCNVVLQEANTTVVGEIVDVLTAEEQNSFQDLIEVQFDPSYFRLMEQEGYNVASENDLDEDEDMLEEEIEEEEDTFLFDVDKSYEEVEEEDEDLEFENMDEESPWRCYIPFVEQIVPVVDLNNHLVIIDPPPGLLNLSFIKQEKVVLRGKLPEVSLYEAMKLRQQ